VSLKVKMTYFKTNGVCPLLKKFPCLYIIDPGEIMKKIFPVGIIFTFFLISGLYSNSILPADERADLIKKAAMEIINSSQLCVLISTGTDGYPNARMMDPFPPDKEWVIWMGTNLKSRKVEEIRKNGKISVYYEADKADGYVILKGKGYIVDDAKKKSKYFKNGWEQFYPGNRDGFILIKFVPERLEIVSYKNQLLGDILTWEPPAITFQN